MFTPRNLNTSSVRPRILEWRGRIDPQVQAPGMIRVMSRVRYRMSGAPSFASVVTTISPHSPGGIGCSVSGSRISSR